MTLWFTKDSLTKCMNLTFMRKYKYFPVIYLREQLFWNQISFQAEKKNLAHILNN